MQTCQVANVQRIHLAIALQAHLLTQADITQVYQLTRQWCTGRCRPLCIAVCNHGPACACKPGCKRARPALCMQCSSTVLLVPRLPTYTQSDGIHSCRFPEPCTHALPPEDNGGTPRGVVAVLRRRWTIWCDSRRMHFVCTAAEIQLPTQSPTL